MNDVSELFKVYYDTFYKGGNKINICSQNQKNFVIETRRNNRSTLLNLKRNIPEIISPVTPFPSTTEINPNEKKKLTKAKLDYKDITTKKDSYVQTQNPVVNKRLEQLAKWKAEKQRRKELEKSKAKPIFKVYHVQSQEVSNLETANKVIKGKLISTFVKKSQFAPTNHKFRAPNGVEPINFNVSGKKPNSDNNKLLSPKMKCSTLKEKKNEIKKSGEDSSITSNQTKKVIKKELLNVTLDKGKPDMKPAIKPKSSLKNINKKTDSKQEIKSVKEDLSKKVQKMPNSSVNKVVKKEDKMVLNIVPEKEREHTMTTRQHKIPSKNRTKSTDIKQAMKGFKKEFKSKVQKIPNLNVSTDKNEKSNQITASNYEETPKKNTKKGVIWAIESTVSTPSQSSSPRNKVAFRKTPKRPNNNKNALDYKVESAISHSEVPYECSSSSTDYSIDYDIDNIKSLNSSCDKESPSIYLSPFVTISRGKRAARDEYKARHSQGGECNDSKFLSSCTSPKAGAKYFRNQLTVEIDRIMEMCHKWEQYLGNPDLSEEAQSSIDVALGQSKLLLSSKFQQFKDLIVQCENQEVNEKAITAEDLHGFWDMMYIQVLNLNQKFDDLEKLKENNWKEMVPQRKVCVKKGKERPAKVQAISKLKDIIQAARQRKKVKSDENEILVTHTTPLKEISQENVSSKRRSLRTSILTLESKKRISSSPGLAVMRVSQSIKQGNGLTPIKSILKSEISKSSGKKSVVFQDDLCNKSLCKTALFLDEDKENNSKNLIIFSPLK